MSINHTDISTEFVTSESQETPDERIKDNSNQKSYCIASLGFVLFTVIIMVAGIVIVCFTTAKPRYLCQSNFNAVIGGNSFQHDSHPRSIATGDFNHDNMLDIVVVNSGTNGIIIFLNYGSTIFVPMTTITTGDSSSPISVALGDFNNDTHLDIAVANYDTHNIGLFLGYGNGSFANQTTFFTGASRPVSITVGDLNYDDWLDLIFTNNGTNDIGILFGYGNGSFGNQTRYSTGYDSFPSSIAVADFNNDHYLDIAVANYGTNIVGIFLGYKNGSFTMQIIYSTNPGSSPSSIAVNDFNNDGYLDIVVANSGTNNVGIFFGYGNGSFASQKTYAIALASRPHSIVIGDFNGDNLMDITVSNYITNDISILIGYGNGSFATPTTHSTDSDSSFIGMTVGDFTNDNQSDIAIANFLTNNVLLLVGYSLIQSQNPTAYSTGVGSLPYQVATGDFNNDSQLDLVVANYGTNNIGLFLGYGDGSFQEQTTYSTGNNTHPFTLTIDDLDNDYQLDIAVGYSNTESLGILYGYGDGTFATVVTYFTGHFSTIRSVTIGDFNNDTHLDIGFTDDGSDNIGVFLGYGNRTFGNFTKYSSGDSSRPYWIATADLNDDGRLDFAVVNYGTNSIGIFLGYGNVTFTSVTIYSTGDGSFPWMLVIVDVNKDNYLDIVVVNSGTNNVGVFFGLGNGSFGAQMTYSTGASSSPYWVSVADFNNDHLLDLAVTNFNLENVGIFLGNDQGYFDNQITYLTGSNSQPYSIVAGDFNKDNRLDIAVVADGTSSVAILLGHPSEDVTKQTTNATNTTWISSDMPLLLGNDYEDFISQTTYSTGSSSRPYSIAVGDLNNDKNMDIAVTNSGNKNLGILFGYGNGTFSTETIRSLGVGASPLQVVIDNFNNDNYFDIAITNDINDSIVVLLGDGNGTFSTELTYSTGVGSKPSTLAVGNFNNDKYLDLVVTNKGTDTIGIFFGYDYTFFSRQKSCESGNDSQPASVAIGDFNHDGYLDIVSALYISDNVGIFLGYGNGSFTPIMKFSYIPLSHTWSVAVGDFNNDTQLDITVTNWGIDSISVILGYGNGSFADPIMYSTGSGSRPLSVAVGDLNNDHSLDIIVANYGGNSIAIFLGYGDGTFQNGTTVSTGKDSHPISLTISDINNDTESDIIVVNEGINNVGVFLGYGNGSFAEQVTSSTGTDSSPEYAGVGDFNKDGKLDLTIANYGTSSVGVLYGYGNGTFGNLQTYQTGNGSNPLCVQVGDFNNDNQLDIIVGDETSSNVGVFFGYTDGTFASMSIVPLGQGSTSYNVAVGDFNNDNRLDFTLVDESDSRIDVFLGYGSKPFGGQTTFFVGEGSHPSSVAVGNFNDDNLLDIAITNYGTNDIGIFLGYGDRLFSDITRYSTGDNSGPLSLAIGEFNNDSLADIVVANSETNNVVVLMGYGNGSFSTFMTYSTGASSQPMSVAVGDFNRDYQLDIAVANFGTNNVYMIFGCGNGSFINQTRYPLGYDSRPNWIVFKDLNNDGWKDISVAAYGVDNIEILLNLC